MPKSPLLDEEVKIIERPDYSDDEETYLKNLKQRLTDAKNQRDQTWDEFDGMDYLTYYESNEKLANTFLKPKNNKEDTNFQSGTVRQKLFALLAALTNLDLGGDISAYDKDALKIQALGDAMEDIVKRTEELDNDEEKKFLRFYELLKHGTVFVEEVWLEQQAKKKRMRKPFTGKLDSEWTEKVEKAFARPSRNIIPGTNVYLGDMTKYDLADQPFVFTVEEKPYDEAEAIFGKWDRWKYVPRELQEVEPKEKEAGWGDNWRLLESKKDRVEIVRYQDKWNNEFAILINGVLMTPVGLPIPYGLDDYTLVQQNLEPIHSKFAYGKSLVARIKNKVALLDEFQRLGILKTQKSFMPPYLNLSGRLLTSRVFMPGKITHGIPQNSLVPLSEKDSQGVTSSEMSMIAEIQKSIDAETTSPVFSGQPTQGKTTATEVIELQRQAKMVLGLTIFAASALEWKLTWKRLKNIIANWFKEETNNVGVDRMIEGEGQGRRIIVPTKELPTAEAILKAEDALSMEQGMPVRLIFIKPDDINMAKLQWQVVVRPKEKRSSELNKLLFRAEFQDAQAFGQLLKIDYWAERFASIWDLNPQKAFKKTPEASATAPITTGGAMSPEQTLPTAEKMLGQETKNALGTNV